MNKLKGQGEIFGIALVFVILILGIIIYAQFKALNPDEKKDQFKERRFKELASSTIPSILEMSTGCYVNSRDDSLKALIGYCYDFSTSRQSDPSIYCDDLSAYKNSCSYSINILNSTLQVLFLNDSSRRILAGIPFSLTIRNEEFKNENIERNITNLNSYFISYKKSDANYYRKVGFSKVNGGLFILETSKRSVEFEFNLYYK